MYRKLFIGLLIISSFANASNGFASEFSHFAGGVGIVWLVAYLVFRFLPKYKTKSILIGFIVSMVYVTIDQSIDYIKDGAFLNQLLDFSVHALGSLLAVYMSHTFIKRNK
jgi:hypothetical protein